MAEENLVEIGQQGLQCDAPACDYKYIFVEGDTYTKYLNAPCPKCGANLLTQEDHDTMVLILEQIEAMNEAGFELPTLPPEIQALVDQLETPEAKAVLKMEFIDGIPVMSSDDPEVQSILEQIEDYYRGEAEVMQKIDELENE